MRKLLLPLVALAFLVPAPARALIFLGVRGGYAMPSGDAAKDQPIKDGVKSNLPVQVDVGMSVFPYVGAGLYGSYAYTTPASVAKQRWCGTSCTGQNVRGGLQLIVRVPILTSLWAGAFGGFEQQSLSGNGTSYTYRGWEGGLQAGYDFSLLPLIKVGPFASYSVAQYLSGNHPLGEKAKHTQLTLGLRALFDL